MSLKRSLLLSFAVLLLLASCVNANSWSWWAPSVQDKPDPVWNQILWPDLIQQPKPKPGPALPIPGSDVPLQPLPPSSPKDKTPLPGPSLTSEELTLIDLVNQERIRLGLKALQIDNTLVALAKKKSHDLAANNYFSHVSPTFGTVYTMLEQAGANYSLAGENIARTGSFSRIHPLFMSSAGHRANIIYSGYTHIGVGVLKHGTSYFATQIFIKK